MAAGALVIGFSVLLPAGSVWAQQYCHWNGSFSQDWFNLYNWDNDINSCPSRAPTSSFHADIYDNDGGVVIDAGPAESASLFLAQGRLTIQNGGSLTSSGAYHYIGRDTDPDIRGILTITGAGSAWNVEVTDADRGIHIGRNSPGTLILTDGGVLNVSGAGNRIILGESEDANTTAGLGTLVIGAVAGESASAPGSVDTGEIEIGRENGDAPASGLIVFNHTDTSGDYTFAPDISGKGRVEHYAGTTALTGNNDYSGDLLVEGGTLALTGDNRVRLFTLRDGTIVTAALGERQSYSHCPGLAQRELIDCLAPDRRVTVTALAGE